MDRLRANHDGMTFSTNAGVLVSIIAWGTGAHDDLDEASKQSRGEERKLGASALSDKDTLVNFARTCQTFYRVNIRILLQCSGFSCFL